mmetsp:Transcript_46752/g.136083  ORF Transcript_46752/g.136083 Transcript_46752/m.136083 type:complete len:338 (-) Transcript_46752:1125-2138(-)
MGSPVPVMSFTFSTWWMSTSSALTSILSLAPSSLAASSFFSAPSSSFLSSEPSSFFAFRFEGSSISDRSTRHCLNSASRLSLTRANSFQSFCSLFHSSSCVCHFDHWSLNHSPAWRSSTFCVRFCSKTQSLSTLAQAAAGCHGKASSSKPSSLDGNVKSAKLRASTFSCTSGTANFRQGNAFSSSVSSTGLSASSSFFSASSSSFFASSFFSPSAFSSPFSSFGASASFISSSPPPSPSFLLSLSFSASSPSAFCSGFFSSSASFRRPPPRRSRAALSASACACFSSSIKPWMYVLYFASGSPIRTTAFCLKPAFLNRASTSFRSLASRFEVSSGTT